MSIDRPYINQSHYVDNPFESPAVLSFCPGILGLERGLARAIGPIRVAAYVEIEAFICANLVAGMEAGLLDPAPVWTDATSFDARPFRGRIHGIIGGYPCPGESTAGLREGHLYKGFIWPSIRRAIAASRPLWCYFENVDDHLTGTYPIVQRSLRNMGYAVEAGVFSAEEVGAPHERQRLFILAILGDAKSKHQFHDWNQSGESERQIRGSGPELAHPKSQGIRGLSEREQGQTWQVTGHSPDPDGGGETLANTSGTGSQGLQPGFLPRKGKGVSGPVAQCRPQDFPLGQGTDQWEWEEPRTVESGVVYTVDGYNFTGDLHRAIGNSVVEQTAEIAFRSLMQKHLKNFLAR